MQKEAPQPSDLIIQPLYAYKQGSSQSHYKGERNMEELSGYAGIVTGGSSGIGLEIANQLALAGAAVYVVSRTGKEKEGLQSSPKGVIHQQGDIRNRSEMQALVQRLAATHGGQLDFLVNNAGSSYKCLAQDFPEEEYDRIMEINVKAGFQMAQLLYPYLKRSPHKGRILNISSMSAHLGFSQVVPYCISKAAVVGMTRGLATEWANENICVNSIAPGWFHSRLLDEIADEKRRTQILQKIPVHAFGNTEDLGALAAFLIGPHGSYINGQDLAVDGGALCFGF